jgi:hypothetical protein
MACEGSGIKLLFLLAKEVSRRPANMNAFESGLRSPLGLCRLPIVFYPGQPKQEFGIGDFGGIDSSQGAYGLSITVNNHSLFKKEQQ